MAHSTGNIQKGTPELFGVNEVMRSQKLKQNTFKKVGIFENNVLLINPLIDASDKEIFFRNEIRSIQDKMRHLLNTQDRLTGSHKLFIPQQLGKFSNSAQVMDMHVKNFSDMQMDQIYHIGQSE